MKVMTVRDALGHDKARISRLRALAERLDRLPPSAVRDRLLRDVRHRAVMLDLGVPAGPAGHDLVEQNLFARVQHQSPQAIRASR
jgi:hypothetical protein